MAFTSFRWGMAKIFWLKNF